MQEYVRIAIEWGPTALFTLIVVLCFIRGVFRGFRKGLILFIFMMISLLISSIVYTTLTTNGFFDNNTIPFANKILSLFNGPSIQSLLGINEETTSLVDALIEYLLKTSTEVQKYEFLIMGMKSYIAMLADMIYHVIAFLLVVPLYLWLRFTLFIIYLIFLREGRRKKKIKKLYENNLIPNDYSKQRFAGGLIGALRGCVVGIILLSFLGTDLYIIFNDGTDKRESIQFGDSQIGDYYEIYRSASTYGENGIFAVLNQFKNEDDEPYYFMIADSILSVNIDDPEYGFTKNVVYRKELNTYVKFVEDTVDLVVKYSKEDISLIVSNNDMSKIQDVLKTCLADKNFKTEFKELINEFEDDTIVINFSISLIDTLARNLKQLVAQTNISIPEPIVDIVDILFGENGVKPSDLVTKDDIKHLLCMAIDLSTDIYEDISSIDTLDVTNLITKYSNDVINNITKLSMFTNKNTIKGANKILNNLYYYLADTLHYKSNINLDFERIGYKITDIDWIKEIKNLLNLVNIGIEFYARNFETDFDVNNILNMFDPSKCEYANENIESFNLILETIDDSSITSALFGMTVVQEFLQAQFKNNEYLSNFRLPQNLKYSSTHTNGVSNHDGEIYKLLYSLKSLYMLDFNSIIEDFKNIDTNNPQELLDKVYQLLSKEVLNPNGNEVKLYQLLFDSDLIMNIISQFIPSLNDLLGNTNINNISLKLYIPNACYSDVSNDGYKVLTKESLYDLVESIDKISKLLAEIDMNNLSINSIFEYKNDLFELMDSSKILEGTVCNLIINLIQSVDEIRNYIVITESINDVETWLKTDSSDGEIANLFNAIENSSLGILDAINSNDFNSIGDKLKTLITQDDDYEALKNELNVLNSSRILSYSFTNIINSVSITKKDDSFTLSIGDNNPNSYGIVAPVCSLENTGDLVYKWNANTNKYESTNSPLFIYNADIIVNTLKQFKPIIDNINDNNALISYLVGNLESLLSNPIVHATIINFMPLIMDMVKTADFSIEIPSSYLNTLEKDKLVYNYYNNDWIKNNELILLFDALDEVTNIRAKVKENNFDINLIADSLNNIINTLFDKPEVITSKGYSRKIDVIFASGILRGTVSKIITNTLANALYELSKVSYNGNIYYLADEEYIKKALSYYQIDGCYNIDDVDDLLNVLDVFGLSINDILAGNYDADKIKDTLFKLDKKADDKYQLNGSNYTNIDVIYRSSIAPILITNALSIELAKLFESEGYQVRDDMYDKIISLTYNSSFDKSEIESILNSFKALGINDINDITNIDAASLLFTLNDRYEDTNQTKLEVIYSSNIIRVVVSHYIDKALLDNSLVNDSRLLDSIKYQGYFQEKDLSSFIAVIVDEFQIKSLNDINNFDFTELFFNLSKTSKMDPTQTTGQVLFKSGIVRVLVTEAVENILITYELVDNASFLTPVKTNGLLSLENLENFINVFKEIGITSSASISQFDMSNAIELLFTLNNESKVFPNKTRIDVVYSDPFNQVLFSNLIDKALIDVEIVKSKSVLDTIKNNNEYNAYSKDELLSLEPALKVLGVTKNNLAIGDVNNILNTLTSKNIDNSNMTNLDVIFESRLVSCIISLYFDDILRNINIRGDFIEFMKIDDGTALKKDVLVSILDLLQNKLNLTNLANIYIDDLYDQLLDKSENGKTLLEEIYSPSGENSIYSALFIREAVRATIDEQTYKNVRESAFSEDIDASKSLYRDDNMANLLSNNIKSLGFYKIDELLVVLRLIKYIEENNDLPTDSDACLNVFNKDNFTDAVMSSELLKRFIGIYASYGIEDTKILYVPNECFDESLKTLKDEDLRSLIRAIDVTKSSDVTKIEFSNTIKDSIKDSKILRATLTMNLNIPTQVNLPSKLYIDYSSPDYLESRINNKYFAPIIDIDNKLLFSLSELEFDNLFNVFDALGVKSLADFSNSLPKDINTILNYDDEKIETILKSNIIKNYITEFLCNDNLALSINLFGQTYKLSYNSDGFSMGLAILITSNMIDGLSNDNFSYEFKGERLNCQIIDNKFPAKESVKAYNINAMNTNYKMESFDAIGDDSLIAFIKLIQAISKKLQ